MIEAVQELFNDPDFFILLAVFLLSGIVRGFAGFGAGMIIVPTASALYGPHAAVVIMWLADTFPTIPIVVPALRKAQWRKAIAPTFIGYVTTVGIGVWVLLNLDVATFRTSLSIVILISACVLATGWRYEGARPIWLSVGVGLIAGLMGGAALIAAPPLVIYWLASRDSSDQIRANIIGFFLLSGMLTALLYWWNDVFTAKAMLIGAAVMPANYIGIRIGKMLFPLASQLVYRRIAIALIVLSAILSLPVLDAVLR